MQSSTNGGAFNSSGTSGSFDNVGKWSIGASGSFGSRGASGPLGHNGLFDSIWASGPFLAGGL